MKRHVLLKVLLLILCTASYGFAFAQERTVTGIVSDQDGGPLAGASVSTKGGKTVSTVTDANGAFRISVPSSVHTLSITYVGAKPQEVSIDGKNNVLVNMEVTDTKLSEVVVVGYGTKRRADITSAISSINEKDIRNLPVAGVDQALQGKVAGVSVTSNTGQPGGGVSVRVRGITSVNGNEPLYVVDGVPIMSNTSSVPQDQLGGRAGQSQQSVLATLNPSDILSIDILKDASAQAIYGSLGANGVVLITTKRGKSGEGKISYDVYHGWQTVPQRLDVMNLPEFASYFNSVVGELRALGLANDSIGELKNPSLLGKGTNWQDEIYRTGQIDNHQLSFSGGQGKTNYYFSLNYFNQSGIIIGSDFRRYAGRFSIDHQVKTWLKAGISSNFSRTDQRIALTDGTETPTTIVLYNSPATPVKDAYGQYIVTTSLGNNTFGNANSNPIATAMLRDVGARQTKVFGNAYVDIQFAPFLSFRNEFNFDYQLGENHAFQPNIRNDSIGQTILAPSRLREDRNISTYWGLRNYLTFNKSFGKHSINVVAGHESQSSEWNNAWVSVTNLNLNLMSLSAGTVDISQTSGNKGEWAMESWFGRASYTFDNRYSITGSIRRDGASSFGPDKRIGYFSAGSIGWTVTNEQFAKDWKFVNYLKLRGGMGSVGNQNSPVQNAYSTNIRLFSVAPFGAGGVPANVGNPALSWESVVTYNAGLDATLFNRRLELSVDVYNKKTTDMILSTTLPVFSGLDPNPPNGAYNNIEPPVTNAGEMSNKGIDISLTSYNVQTKDFTWKTTVIFSKYKNKLVKMNAPGAIIRGAAQDFTGNASVVNITRAGYAVGSFFGFRTNGLYRSEAELLADGITIDPNSPYQGIYIGDIRYVDVNGDKIIGNEDAGFIGDPNPDFTYAMTNTLQYKQFDLSIFIQGVQGSKIFNWTRKYSESLSNLYLNQLTTVMDRYRPDHTNTDMPRYNQWNNNNLRNSDRYIEDGSYLRIQNIAIGYNVPVKWSSKARMSNARIYISAQNLYTFTKYSGYDPEIGSFNKNVLSQNVDNGHYPNPRSLTIGANIEF